VAALRGYEYQIWHTVHDWLDLKDEALLFVEGAEDFDVVSPTSATAAQIKDTKAKVTLRTHAAIEAISHFWQLQKAHPDTRVFFRFVTRSEIGVERGEPFGKGVAGLDLWKRSGNQPAAIKALSEFLVSEAKLPPDLIGFLKTGKPEDVRTKLIAPIVWETKSPEVGIVEEAIKRKLILHGESRVPPTPPSESSKVVSRLLKEVFAIATKKSNRCLDYAYFLEVFEDETTERVTRQEITTLRNRAAASTLLPASLGLSSPTTPFQASLPVETSIPPTTPDIAPRSKVVNELVATLQELGVLVLVGSTGTGKTTLAKLIATRCGGSWRWVSFSTVEPEQYAYAFRSLAILLENEPEANSILLDDINLSPEHSRQLEDYFAGVLYTILQRKGRLIITGQKELPRRLSQHIGLQEKSTQVAPALIYEEIADLAVQLGCQSREDARAWAAITLIHTSGHVQLVHAQMKNLVRQGWPKPSTDDVLKQPVDVRRALSEARMLLKELPEGHRELLYRLSLVAGLFRRDHAISIGELKPTVHCAGDVYDQLIGPWIEHVDHEYMRVSPLLKGCANQVWSENKIKELHEAIGFAILRCTPRTQWEASTVLMHGIVSSSGALILVVVNSILGGGEKMIAAVAPTLSWLKAFIKPGTQIFPKSKSVNFMLRLLQFRVAAQLEPETTAVDALAVWESDPMPDSPAEFTQYARTLYLGSLLHQIKVPIAPRKLVRAIVETADLADKLPPFREIFEKVGTSKDEAGRVERFDPISVALLITIARPASVQFLDELLDALEQDAPDATRERMLAGLRKNDSFARTFLDAVWVEESKLATPNWPNCVCVFEKCIALAQRWNVPDLTYAAARGIAIIRDEYQNDKRGALAVLDQHAPREGPPSITIENERATVLLHLKDFDAALACWEKILPIWQNPPTTEDNAILFALNKAGKAAARAGNWKKAADLFADGSSRAESLSQHVQAAGFRTDAAWALWKAGEHHQAYRALCETLQAVEGLPAPQTMPYLAKVQKSFGHILVCIKREIEHEDYGEPGEPPPGLASDPDASEKWQSPPMLWCLVFLAEIECYLNLEPVVFLQARARVATSRSPLLRSLIAELEVRYAFRKLQFETLPQIGRELETSVLVSKVQREKGRTGFEEADAQLLSVGPTEQSQSVLPTLLTQALIASLAGNGAPVELIERWGENAAELSDCVWINTWLNSAKKAFVVSTPDALAMMGDNNLPSDVRLLAATRLAGDLDSGVDRMFNAQVWIVGWLGQSKMFWNYDVANHFASHLARAWKKQCTFRAALRNPRLTVPEIERACDSKDEGVAKAAKILLAAANAVTIQLSDEVRTQLQALASAESVNPYRFA
jgi:tetratricopeptide (TPR) repeat protein/energy-coupling factor transporter ATP-binding protein EcfA2